MTECFVIFCCLIENFENKWRLAYDEISCEGDVLSPQDHFQHKFRAKKTKCQ